MKQINLALASFSVLIEYLLEEYGFQGTLFILGGCMLHLCISGALYRPLPVHVLITRNNRMRKMKQEGEPPKSFISQPPQPPEPHLLHTSHSHSHCGVHHHLHYHQPLVRQ